MDDYEMEEAKRESAFDEREQAKNAIKQHELTKKEEEDLCGPRLTRKIDQFIFEISVEAGLQTSIDEKSPRSSEQNKMLQTGNTSLFQLEKQKNDDFGMH